MLDPMGSFLRKMGTKTEGRSEAAGKSKRSQFPRVVGLYNAGTMRHRCSSEHAFKSTAAIGTTSICSTWPFITDIADLPGRYKSISLIYICKIRMASSSTTWQG